MAHEDLVSQPLRCNCHFLSTDARPPLAPQASEKRGLKLHPLISAALTTTPLLGEVGDERESLLARLISREDASLLPLKNPMIQRRLP